ncbi:MAG TPA: hypothetical protein VFQ37_05640 [Mycobacterium sp.]|nr:hypothetical protein [Mycobacterium sp.]
MTSSSSRITYTAPSYLKFADFDLPRRRGTPTTSSPLVAALVSVDFGAMQTMQPDGPDTQPLPRRYRSWLPLTGLTDHQFRSVPTLLGHKLTPGAHGRPWGTLLPISLLLVLIHSRTNLTTRALAAAFNTSQSAVDGDHSPLGARAGSRAAAHPGPRLCSPLNN